VRTLGRLVTVSAKIPEELKKKMDELKIRPSKIVREAIKEEIRRKEVEKLKEMLVEAEPVLMKLSVVRVVKSIREDRDRG
jgi:ribosomal protein L29